MGQGARLQLLKVLNKIQLPSSENLGTVPLSQNLGQAWTTCLQVKHTGRRSHYCTMNFFLCISQHVW